MVLVGLMYITEIPCKYQFLLQDDAVKSINGVDQLSARGLLVTTLADELKIHSIQRSKVVSIAMNAKRVYYKLDIWQM